MNPTGPVKNRHVMAMLSVLFVLPSLMFAFHLSLLPSLVTALGAAATILLLVRPPARRGARPNDGVLSQAVNVRDLAVCLALAVALVILGGEGHLFYANSDWFWRDAVLADLSRSTGLPQYRIDGALYTMRTSLGMYMAPAAVGRLTVLGGAHTALVIQNAVILGAILYGFSVIMPKHRILRLAAMVAFSGLDILPFIIALSSGILVSVLDLPAHINGWAGWQYSSQITQIFWVPNHALPGWWLALLIILCAQGEVSLSALGLSAAAGLFWSPLVVVGAMPFLFLLFLRRLRENLTDRVLYLSFAVALSFLPIALYLVTAADTIKPSVGPPAQFPVIKYGLFMLTELAIPVCVLMNWRRNDSPLNSLALAGAALLTALPLFSFGPNNDLVMRASIPVLTIFAFLFSQLLIGGPPERPGLRGAAIVLAVLAAATGGLEVGRAIIFPRYAISTCDFMSAQSEVAPGGFSANYLVRSTNIPTWLIPPAPAGQAIVSRRKNCWPDYPFDPQMYEGSHTLREYFQMLKARRR